MLKRAVLREKRQFLFDFHFLRKILSLHLVILKEREDGCGQFVLVEGVGMFLKEGKLPNGSGEELFTYRNGFNYIIKVVEARYILSCLCICTYFYIHIYIR